MSPWVGHFRWTHRKTNFLLPFFVVTWGLSAWVWVAGWKAGIKVATLTTMTEQETWKMMIGISGHGMVKCNHCMKRVAVAVKLVSSTFPSDSIPPLSLGSYTSNFILSGIFLISHQSLFLLFILQFSFSLKRASLTLSSLSTYCNMASA